MAVAAQGAGADHNQIYAYIIEAGGLDMVLSTIAGEVCITYTLPRFVLFENVDFRYPYNIMRAFGNLLIS